MTGRGSVSKLFIHLGMLCAALAFASWWTSHTILDTARTRRVTEAVLQSTDLRHFVADHVASVTAPAVGVTATRSHDQRRVHEPARRGAHPAATSS